jgi:putative ABC transport system permease protein
LLRYPALFVAVLAGTALLTFAAAAYPLFLSATASEIVSGAIGRPHITPYGAGLTYRFVNLPLDPVRLTPSPVLPTPPGSPRRTPDIDAVDAAARELLAGDPTLGDPLAEVVGDPVSLSMEGVSGTQMGRLLGASGVLEHIERLAGTDGHGVWVPELIAEDLGVGPGDEIALAVPPDGRHEPVEVTVDGIYRDIYFAWPSDGFWLQWEDTFRLEEVNSDIPPPPQPILTTRERALSIMRELGQTSATFSWQAPLADPAASLADVQALDRYETSLHTLTFQRSRLGRTLFCCVARWSVPLADASTSLTSSIDAVVTEAERRVVVVRGPADVLEIAALAVALVVVAAVGASSMRTRRTEAAWLHARGTSPLLVGTHDALGALLPALAGAAIGLGLAAVAVVGVGPDGAVERSAYADAAVRTAVGAAVAVVLAGIAAGRTYSRIVDPHGRRLARVAAAVPWELGAIWLGYLAYRRLDQGGAFYMDPDLGVGRPSLALVAFPFLMLVGFAFLAGRLAHLGFRGLRAATGRAAPPLYLATRRLATGGALAVALIGAAGLCLGMFIDARVTSASLQATVSAKARVFVGSEVAAQIAFVSRAPDDLAFPITRVLQVGDGVRLPSGRTLDLLAIDPDTFAGAAYWNDAFGERPLDVLMDAIHEPERSDPLPVILAAGGALDATELTVGSTTVPVEVVERVDAFPGLISLRPMVVVDERALSERLAGANPFVHGWAELWAPVDRRTVEQALARAEIPVYQIVTAEEVEDIPAIAATVETFVIVNVLGTIAAVLTLVSMLLYLRARQRSQTVAFALSARMGMSRAQRRGALALELGLMIGIGFAVGMVLAIVVARVAVPFLDPFETIPPAPLFLMPRAPILVTALAAGLVTWVGSGIVDRQARSADLAEVMRVAE